MSATADTYGVLLYQEQVMDVMETLGMGPAELEEMLDAVKASNEYSKGAAVAIEQAMPRIRSWPATGGGRPTTSAGCRGPAAPTPTTPSTGPTRPRTAIIAYRRPG